LWIQTLLNELAAPYLTPMVLCDNSNVVQMAHGPVLHAKTKHMELDLSLLCQRKSLVQEAD